MIWGAVGIAVLLAALAIGSAVAIRGCARAVGDMAERMGAQAVLPGAFNVAVASLWVVGAVALYYAVR